MMRDKIVISGIGMIGDFGAGKKDFCTFLSVKKNISDLFFDDYIDTSPLRRADELSYCATIAAKLALQDAKLDHLNAVCNKRIGVVLGTTHGSLAYSIDYNKELIMNGPAMVSPMLFSNSVLNAPSSYVSAALNIQGASITISGYTPVFQALKYAMDLIRQDILDCCLVGGVDVYNEIILDGYSNCIKDTSMLKNRYGGSGFVVVESAESQKKRGVVGYAEIQGTQTFCVSSQNKKSDNIFNSQHLLDSRCSPGVDYVLASYNQDGAGVKFEKYLLENTKENNVVNCTKIFGHTFAASESFQIIFGAMALQGSNDLSGLDASIARNKNLDSLMISKSFKASASYSIMTKMERRLEK